MGLHGKVTSASPDTLNSNYQALFITVSLLYHTPIHLLAASMYVPTRRFVDHPITNNW